MPKRVINELTPSRVRAWVNHALQTVAAVEGAGAAGRDLNDALVAECASFSSSAAQFLAEGVRRATENGTMGAEARVLLRHLERAT